MDTQMKGTLIKKPEGWFVKYANFIGMAGVNEIYDSKELPLHPDSLFHIVNLCKLFNIEFESVEFTNPNIEFEIVNFKKHMYDEGDDYAKLIQPKQEEESSWDDISLRFNHYRSAMGQLEIWEWLKQQYFPPKKR